MATCCLLSCSGNVLPAEPQARLPGAGHAPFAEAVGSAARHHDRHHNDHGMPAVTTTTQHGPRRSSAASRRRRQLPRSRHPGCTSCCRPSVPSFLLGFCIMRTHHRHFSPSSRWPGAAAPSPAGQSVAGSGSACTAPPGPPLTNPLLLTLVRHSPTLPAPPPPCAFPTSMREPPHLLFSGGAPCVRPAVCPAQHQTRFQRTFGQHDTWQR